MLRKRTCTFACIVLLLAFGLFTTSMAERVPGDADNNGITSIADAICIINYIFGGGPAPPNQSCADVTNDCAISISDALMIATYIFGGHPPALVLGCPHQEFNPGCYMYSVGEYPGGGERPFVNRGCINDLSDSTESMELEYSGNDLYVYHNNAYYQCCLAYAVDIQWQSARHITVIESDTFGIPCPCECYFNLEAVISDLAVTEVTTFVVTLVGIYGNTVGIDSITIGGNGSMYAEVLGNDLHIHHLNAHYQCCLGYLVEYEIEGYNITAVEADTGMPCDCMCYFNLKSVLYDLEDGEYTITLIGIDGEVVGKQTVVVDNDYGLVGYNADGCLDRQLSFDPPDVEYTYENGLLVMHHYNGYYNCGSRFMVQFESARDTLRFLEVTINDDCAYCMCYFYLTATVAGTEPGNYIAEIWGQDCLSPLTLVDRREIVLGL